MFEGKARFVSKAERTRKYVSILKRIGTQPSGIRWDFNTNSIVYQGNVSFTIFVSG